MEEFPGILEIRAAADRIEPWIHRTPVLTCATIDALTGGHILFKCENFQKIGAFKMRGASNAVLSLTDEQAARGVATHSSGNHAQALALAARLRGIPAWIVMPRTAPKVKRDAVAGYGAEIVECEPTLAARETALAEVVARTGAHFVPPFDDLRIITGQATAAMELIDDCGPPDILLMPVGGGGLMSGSALAAYHLAPGTRVIAAEPAGADDAHRGFYSGTLQESVNPKTIADGLLTSLSELTFSIMRRYVHQVVTVQEVSIKAAMRLVWERMKIIIEPSSAVPLAAILEGKVNVQGKRVGLIVSGGNVDVGKMFE